MDPNEALKEMRRLRGELFANGEPYDQDTVRMLIEAEDALDVWLSKGGFLPDDWKASQ